MSDLYNIIYVDAPWRYDDKAAAGKRGVEFKYPVMSVKDICALPVGELAAEDAVLFLWATCPQPLEALVVMEAWGFEYKTVGFVWVKITKYGDALINGPIGAPTGSPTGVVQWGMGNWTRANAELCLLGIRGRPQRVNKAVHQIVFARPGQHSAKPPEVRERIVQLMGDVPRIELFARERVPGWGAHGDELEFSDATFLED